MDIVTQALLGSSVATAGAREGEFKQAAWIGAFAGVLADADIFIRSGTDPLLTLQFHRHFTHALTFIPIGALIAASLIFIVTRTLGKNSLPFSRLYLYCLLGYLLSGILDAFTSYGTHLLWPFTDERISWRLISIVDPFFTTVLLIALLTSIRLQRRTAVVAGLVACALYLGVSSMHSKIIEEEIRSIAHNRGHIPQQLIVKPTLGNIFLWRTVYRNDDSYYIDAIHTQFDRKHYEGDSVATFVSSDTAAMIEEGSTHAADIARFDHFSDGYTAMSPTTSNMIGDVRYALLPTSAQPLWGIRLDLQRQDEHVEYVTTRENSGDNRQHFLDMLFGRDIEPIR